MTIYARIEGNVVAELFATNGNIGELFSPLLTWVDVTDTPEVKAGWLHDAGRFKAPVPAAVPPASPLALLQAQLASLTQQIAALAKAE